MFAHLAKQCFSLAIHDVSEFSFVLLFLFIKLSNQILALSQPKLHYFNIDDITTFCLIFTTIRLRSWALSKHQLTHYVSVLPSYRNQSIDLLCKSIDWFLYEGNTGT